MWTRVVEALKSRLVRRIVAAAVEMILEALRKWAGSPEGRTKRSD